MKKKNYISALLEETAYTDTLAKRRKNRDTFRKNQEKGKLDRLKTTSKETTKLLWFEERRFTRKHGAVTICMTCNEQGQDRNIYGKNCKCEDEQCFGVKEVVKNINPDENTQSIAKMYCASVYEKYLDEDQGHNLDLKNRYEGIWMMHPVSMKKSEECNSESLR